MNDTAIGVTLYLGAMLVAGGILAHKRRDFASRGMAIALLTGVFGVMAMAFSEPSLARTESPRGRDERVWPRNGWIALLFMVTTGAVLVLLRGADVRWQLLAAGLAVAEAALAFWRPSVPGENPAS